MGCPACGGVWADNGASQRVVSALDPEILEAAAAAEEHAAKLDAPMAATSALRVCPECGGGLVRACIAGTTLDVCSRHGTWFDRGELRRVAYAIEHARKRKDPSWRASDDVGWGAEKCSLDEVDPAEMAIGDAPADDEDDLLVDAIAWVARGAIRSPRNK